MAAVLKTARGSDVPRGFESHALRFNQRLRSSGPVSTACEAGSDRVAVSSCSRRIPAVHGCPRRIRGEYAEKLLAVRPAQTSPALSSSGFSAFRTSRVAFSIRRRAASSSCPATHVAETRSSTAALCPAHSATWGAGAPALSHVDTAAWRRSYGRRASGDAVSAGVRAVFRAARQTGRYDDSAKDPPNGPTNRLATHCDHSFLGLGRVRERWPRFRGVARSRARSRCGCHAAAAARVAGVPVVGVWVMIW